MKKITLISSLLLFTFFGLIHSYALEIGDNQNTWDVFVENSTEISHADFSSFYVNEEFAQVKDFSHFYDIRTQTLILTSPNSPFSDVMIFNVLGQEVLSQKLSGKTESLDISGLVNGLYIVKVNFDTDSKIIKVLKQ